MLSAVTTSLEKMPEVCRRHGVKKLSFFGSVLRDDFRADSDIDALFEFDDPRRDHDYRAIFALERDLESLFGRTVDLMTENDLKWVIRDSVIASAQVVYAA